MSISNERIIIQEDHKILILYIFFLFYVLRYIALKRIQIISFNNKKKEFMLRDYLGQSIQEWTK